MIPNHVSARLSLNDMEMVRAVPPGGNWKDIPLHVPSKRLEQIRESYARGEGSRSTYYGRLRPDMPSYTITTYFNRPGNGCNVHYAQDRVISQREAARFQSFPDSFVFQGTQGSVNKQIGNAVPPLLSFQIAAELGIKGNFVDLFSGAGGLGLGFKWAGWDPVLANDIDASFLNSYSANVHSEVIWGSIADPDVMAQLINKSLDVRNRFPEKPFWVLGGPPCQGFSTAGNRSSTDERNLLFWEYKKFLDAVQPDGFVFENVTGLLNMDGGRVFEKVRNAFSGVMPNLKAGVLAAERFGVPQRRKRVIIVGARDLDFEISLPEPWSEVPKSGAPQLLPLPPGARDVLADLPALEPGEDGSHLGYVSEAQNAFQRFLRGEISPEDYLRLSAAKRSENINVEV